MNKKTLAGGTGVVLALILSLLALVGGNNQPVSNTTDNPVNQDLGRGTEFSQVCTNDICKFSTRLALNAGEQFVSKQNTTGGPIFVTHVILNKYVTTATSSSFVMSMGTSSASTLTGGSGLAIMEGGGIYASGTHKTNALGLENLPFGGIVDNLIWSTSTMESKFGSTTSSIDLIFGKNENNRDATTTVTMVEDQEWYWLLLTTGDNEGVNEPGGACGGSVAAEDDNNCSSATSTLRGGNFEAIIDFTATSTRHN